MGRVTTMRRAALLAMILTASGGVASADGNICTRLQSDAASASGTPSTSAYTPDNRYHLGDTCVFKGPSAGVHVSYHRSANRTAAKQLMNMNRTGSSRSSGTVHDLAGLGEEAFSTGGGSVSFLTGTIYVRVMEFVYQQAPDLTRDARQTERVARAIAKHIQRDLH